MLENRVMRIAVVTPSFHPLIGGIELYFLNLSKEFVRRGHEVHVYTADRVMGIHVSPPEEDMYGVKVHRLPVLRELTFRAKLWPSLFRRVTETSPDVIHVCGHDHLHSPVSILAARMRRVSVVTTTWGPLEKQSECRGVERFVFNFYDATVTPILFQMCDKVLARNPLVVPWLRSYHTPERKIRMTPAGIPEDFFTPADGESFRKKYDLEGRIALYVGRLTPQKGCHQLIKTIPHVLERVGDANFVFVGPDYIGFQSQLLKLSHELGVEDHVIFTGPIREAEAEKEAFAASEIFIMPSSFEGFCQAALKAMAQGKPVVLTNVGGLPYVIDHGVEGFLVEYGDSRGMAEAISRLLLSPDLAKKMGEKGRVRVRKYTFPALAEQMEEIYKEVIYGRG